MPFTFPSHPGLILPLWVRRLERYDAVARSVGSVIPDLVDHPIGYLTGRPDFKLVHGLAGLAVVGIPLGLLIVAAVDPVCRRLSACPAVARSPRAAAWLDLPSVLPPVFSRPWLRVPLTGFERPWGIWPFDLVWLALTALGAALFVWSCWKGARAGYVEVRVPSGGCVRSGSSGCR